MLSDEGVCKTCGGMGEVFENIGYYETPVYDLKVCPACRGTCVERPKIKPLSQENFFDVAVEIVLGKQPKK